MDVLGQVLPLALLDTVSVSTLAIPIWFLLTPRGLRMANVVGYLFLVAFGYLLLGIVLLGAVSVVRKPLRTALDSSFGDKAMAAAGIALILVALWYGLRSRPTTGDGRLNRWRDAAVGEDATARGVFTVAFIAVVLEIATMFPYLSAIEVIGEGGSPRAVQVSVLAMYCLVMIAPALLAALLRQIAERAVRPALRRVDRWLRETAQENTAWLLGIVGFVLLSNTTLYEWGLDRMR